MAKQIPSNIHLIQQSRPSIKAYFNESQELVLEQDHHGTRQRIIIAAHDIGPTFCSLSDLFEAHNG